MFSTEQKSNLHNPETASNDAFAALRIPDFRLLIISRTLLFMGFNIKTIAVGWELYQRTHSAAVLGYVGLVEVIPVIGLTLFTGHVADKYNRKLVILLTALTAGFSSLGLAYFSFSDAPLLVAYTSLLISGIGIAFNRPATDALLWELIPKHLFINAATWNNSSFKLGSITGSILGGLAIANLGGAGVAYLLAAITALLSFISVLTIADRETVSSHKPISLTALVAGAKFIWENQLIIAAIILDSLTIFLGGATALFPVFAQDILHIGPMELGYLQAAPSIGALMMALIIAHLTPLDKAGQTLLWVMVGFGVVTIIFGLSHWFLLSLLMQFFIGAFDTTGIIIRNTLVQLNTPNELRGRVSAINGMFITTSYELGSFKSGLTAAWFGPVASVVGGGIGTILVVIAVATIWPEIGKLETLRD